jgi:hypothetical protein
MRWPETNRHGGDDEGKGKLSERLAGAALGEKLSALREKLPPLKEKLSPLTEKLRAPLEKLCT